MRRSLASLRRARVRVPEGSSGGEARTARGGGLKWTDRYPFSQLMDVKLFRKRLLCATILPHFSPEEARLW